MNSEEKKAFNRALMTLAVPLALQNLLNALVGASDALMLGRLSQDAIAAVSLANQVTFVMALFYGIVTSASGVLIAQYWGKKDIISTKRFLIMGIRCTFLINLIFFALAFSIPEMLMRIFTTDGSLIRIGAEYLRIVAFSYFFSGIAQCILMIMKISGHASLSVIISAVTVGVDMFADFFLIYGFGKLPALGANGSALSTVAVELISLIWCLIWLYRNGFGPALRDIFFFSPDLEKDMWKIIPGFLASSLSWGLSIPMHSFILGHLGVDATAASSVTGVAQQLIECLTLGLSGGAGIMLGELLGNNELEKARTYGQRFWGVTLISAVINVALLAVVGPLVYAFYVLEPQTKVYLIQMLIFSAFYLAAFAYNTIITCGVFPAGGDSIYDGISVFIATWCFAIPLALLGCFLLHWPVMTVYIVMCLDEIVKVPFIRWRYSKYIWLKNLTRSEADDPQNP